MSSYPGLVNDDLFVVLGLEAPANIPAVQPRRRNPEPSEEEWELLKRPLIHQRRYERKSGKDLVKWVKEQKYHTTEKMLMERMRKKWGVRTSMTNADKEDICDQLFQFSSGQAELPDLDRTKTRKVMRYCKDNRATSDRYKQLFVLLQRLLVTLPEESASDKESSEENEAPSQSRPVRSSQSLAMSSGSVVLPDFGSLSVSAPSTARGEGSGAIDISHMPWMNTSYIHQPSHFNSADQNAQALFHFSREYYDITLLEYNFTQPSPTPPDADLGSDVDPNYIFWWNIKNALYFAKINSHELVKPELDKAFPLLPYVLESKHCNILKDLMATLSPVATKRCPLLRQHILKAFRDESVRTLGPHHLLSSICRILCDGEGSDDVSTVLLSTMLNKTQQTLKPRDPEILDLSCTLITFHRRNKQFEAAEKLADALIEAEHSFEGRSGDSTRRALSQRLYIHNDQGQYDQALILAEDIVVQAQSFCGHQFPDMRSIYHMEDLAEVYGWLGRSDESQKWLWQALNGAQSRWGFGCSSTHHILDKLRKVSGNALLLPEVVA